MRDRGRDGNKRRVSYRGLKREGKTWIRSGTTGVGDKWGQVVGKRGGVTKNLIIIIIIFF
jgi:hypothetical protein